MSGREDLANAPPDAPPGANAPPGAPSNAPPGASDIPNSRPPEEAPWLRGLSKDKRNKLKTTYANTCAVLRGDTEFGGFSFNERTLQPEFRDQPIGEWLMMRLLEQIELRWGITPGPQLFSDAVMCVAREHAFDPVRNELRELAWDGMPRLDSVARIILGNGGATEALMVRKWFIAAVARAFEPGCKADTMLVLQGDEQGVGKSTFFATLGGDYFCDSVQDFEKDGLLAAHRAWIIELGELDGITRKSAVERIKNVLSRRADDLRRPYARSVETFKRSFVFCGTVNGDAFLYDETGNRRFWTVKVPGAIDIETLRAQRKQLWAEAVEAYRAGEAWWLSAEQAERAEELSQRFVGRDESWDEKVSRWALGAVGEITTRRVLVEVLGFEDARIDRKAETRVGVCMRRLGFERVDVREGARLRRVYRPRGERVRVDMGARPDATDDPGEEASNLSDDSATMRQDETSRSRIKTASITTISTISTYTDRSNTERDREGAEGGDATPGTRAESLECFFGEVVTDGCAAKNAGRIDATTTSTRPAYDVAARPLAPALVMPPMAAAVLSDRGDDLNDLHEPDGSN